MALLPVSFGILQYIGLWQPIKWSGWKKYVYTIFSIFSFIILYTDTLSQVVDVIKTTKSVGDFAMSSYILVCMIGICIKMASIVKNRRKIIDLVHTLQSGAFEMKNEEEKRVEEDCENVMKWRTIIFGIFVQMGTINLIITSFIYLAPHRITITKLYVPWDITTLCGFWVAHILQCISRFFGGPVNVACDSLVSGVMFRAAAQFKILELRLRAAAKSLSNYEKITREMETEEIGQLVKEHLQIFQIIGKLNDIFGFVIFVQYFVSSAVLCVTVFVFAQVHQFDLHCAMMITYTGCLYFQIYLLCSAGTEMTYQSYSFTSYVYESNWEGLTLSTKKSLLLMMLRSNRPLKFTSAGLIELSIESFSQIVKFSYSAYNVLAQSS